jgi:hypothetical protein
MGQRRSRGLESDLMGMVEDGEEASHVTFALSAVTLSYSRSCSLIACE